MIRATKKQLAALQAGKQPEPSEAEFTKQVIAFAQAHGWRVAHFRGVRVQRKNGSTYWQTPVQGDGAGFPDLFMLRDGARMVAELKVGRNKTTPEQHAWLRAFETASIPAFVWTPANWEMAKQVLRDGPGRFGL